MWQVTAILTTNDLHEIEKIGEQSLPYHHNAQVLKYMLKDPKNILLKVEEYSNENNNIIGGFLLAEKRNKGQRLHINSIAINPKYRHLGLGTKLLDKIKEYKCLDITLNVMETNTIARNFYEKNGFTCLKKLHNYYFELNTS